jgi:UDP-N-acetylmuramoyl-L-alanyl-D-glutamate--2,6-diaminopimelate ligase
VKAAELFIDQAIDGPLPSELAGVSRDSRRLQSGEAFIAQADGADRASHMAEAQARGAAAVLAEPAVPHARWAFARASCAAHHLPGTVPVLATTGTKGKSTVTHFAWAALGPGAARIGTIGWHDGRTERPNPQTTPPPDELHAFIGGLPDDCPGVAIEASSHGLDQHRLAGLRLSALAVTNIGRDHLDYHGTTASYVHAKLRIARLIAADGLCVVNADDAHAHRFAHAALNAGGRVIALGVGRSGQQRLPGCDAASALQQGSGWKLVCPGASVDLPTPLPGRFNIWNAAAAVLMAHATGVPLHLAAARLATAPPVPGRLELLAHNPLTYVDYAHTPESLAAAIAALREAHPGRRLAVVFGCGGDRDTGKRATMGAAGSAADALVLTDDNPRSEDPTAIIADIRTGVQTACEVEHQRATAIRRARALAGADGVVLVAGKGHETEQKFHDRTVHWDDRACVRSLDDRTRQS